MFREVLSCQQAKRGHNGTVFPGSPGKLDIASHARTGEPDADRVRWSNAFDAGGSDTDPQSGADKPQTGEPLRCLLYHSWTKAVFLAKRSRFLIRQVSSLRVEQDEGLVA